MSYLKFLSLRQDILLQALSDMASRQIVAKFIHEAFRPLPYTVLSAVGKRQTDEAIRLLRNRGWMLQDADGRFRLAQKVIDSFEELHQRLPQDESAYLLQEIKSKAAKRLLNLFAENRFTPLPYSSLRCEAGSETLAAVNELVEKGYLFRIPKPRMSSGFLQCYAIADKVIQAYRNREAA